MIDANMLVKILTYNISCKQKCYKHHDKNNKNVILAKSAGGFNRTMIINF